MLTSFSGNLFCGLETGHILVIGGRSIDSASGVNVNLTTGKKYDSDIALTLSVRFHEDAIVRNSKIDGSWLEEEREDNLHEFAQPNPLIAGKSLLSTPWFDYTVIKTLFHIVLRRRLSVLHFRGR